MAPIDFYVLVLSPLLVELFVNFKYSLTGGASLRAVSEVSKASTNQGHALCFLLELGA